MIRILKTTLKDAIFSYPKLSFMVLEKGSYMDAHIQSVKQKIGSHGDNPTYLLFLDGQLVAWLELYGPEKHKINVYVHPSQRRKGLGRMLISKAISDNAKKLLAFPYDQSSSAFYECLAKEHPEIGIV